MANAISNNSSSVVRGISPSPKNSSATPRIFRPSHEGRVEFFVLPPQLQRVLQYLVVIERERQVKPVLDELGSLRIIPSQCLRLVRDSQIGDADAVMPG